MARESRVPPDHDTTGVVEREVQTDPGTRCDQISGVGPSIAQNIVDYRNTNGLFYYIEDIKNVSGIADIKFEKMKDEIDHLKKEKLYSN